MIILKSTREIEIMRKGGKIVYEVLNKLEEFIKPGITTLDLETIAIDYIKSYGATPAFKGYRGYPAHVCICVNEEVVHGIPSKDTILKEGDIVSIDIGVLYYGLYTDATRTYPVGKVSDEVKKLLIVTEEALYKGITQAIAGNRLGDISNAIQEHVEKNNFSVIKEMVGHAVGRKLHEDPQVPNYGKKGKGPLLRNGMTLAIEPMVSMGSGEVYIDEENKWTVRTIDHSKSAHFEHTVLITNSKPEILTLS